VRTRHFLLAVVLAFSSLVPRVTPVHATSRVERWAFSVTYDPASRQSLLAHLGQLDVVAPGYFNLAASGQIAGTGDDALDAQVASAGVRILPVVENAITQGDLSPFLNDPNRRAALVSAIAALPIAHGYAGITLDFESIAGADRASFTGFVQALAGALHAEGKQLAVAVAATDGMPVTAWAAPYDQAAIGAAADRVILMAYGYRSAAGTPGPISPLPWVNGAANYTAALVPADHLILGMGVWGYDWNLTRGGRATTLRYAQTSDLIARTTGQRSLDEVNAAASYAYQSGADKHQVWFEDAASVQRKLSVALAHHVIGVAFWRLGQEAPGVWDDLTSLAQPDFTIPHGHFFSQAGGAPGLGFRVVDDNARFWSEFQRLGGVDTLGYPASRRYVGADGFTYQAFQRGVLQWRPELGQAYLANTFDQLTAAQQDGQLATLGIPPPISDDGSDGDWARARQIRLGWLSQPDIARAFAANPNPRAISGWTLDRAIQLYGLPASLPERSGPFVVQRFQRISLQLWVDNVPGMPPPGSVVGILGGDLLKRAGVVPPDAAQPESPFE
jgi:spore germination protein YaaH